MNPSSSVVHLRLPPNWICVVILSLGVLVWGCGGGGVQTPPPPPPPPTPDFTLAVNPTSVSIPTGYSATTSISVSAVNGFSSQVSVQISGLPAGVTTSPTNIVLTPGASQVVTLSAAANSTATAVTSTFTGTSASLMHTAKLSVTVTTSRTGTLSTRTKYLRTDAVTEYYLWVNSHWVVYHPPTSHFFVTDPFSNSVIVLDSVTEKQIAKISVPGAYGIDETPDHSTLYVGTLIGDIYTIDPVTMKVTHRYLASEIGPYGYQALVALVLSDGRLALLGQQGGIPSVDGSSGIAIWSPTNNAISMYGSSNAAGAPTSPLCGSVVGLHIFGFALTRDRTSILTGDGNGLCELNASTGQSQSTALNGNSGSISTSPDGRYLAFPIYPNAVSLYDAHTLTQVAQFSVAGDTSSASDLLFSADSKTLFVPSSSFVYAYDVATHQQIGWLPNIVVEYTSGGLAVGPATNPIFAVTDNTGLLVGPLEEGFGFLDTTALQTGPVGTAFANNFLTPDTGSVTGGTQVQFSVPPAVNAQSNIYFGTTLVPAISTSGTLATVTTPAGQPGPVDVYIFSNDGGMQLVPDGFSYGPTILEVTPDRSSAEGGGVGVIHGYGFMAANATQIPPDLSVKVGGNAVTILGGSPNAYGVEPIPFLLQSVSYTIPPGSAGSAVDVSVTTASGTATVSGALIYLPSLKQFPLAGASLAQGVYDPVRDLYYFTDASKVQVFSLSQNKWLAPISIPAPSGATQRLWGISLSPDASKIAIADAQAGVVYLVDPANPASVKTFSVTPSPPNGTLVLPAGVAITDSGVIYIADDVQGGTGYSNFYKLDTTTGVLTNLFLTGPGLGASDLQLRTVVSADNSRAYFNVLGDVVAFDTSTNVMFQGSVGQGCCNGDYDLTLSPNQTQIEGTGYLFDSDLNGTAAFALNDREVLNISYVYGAKFSPDGSLLFQPATQGMDIYDGRTGTLRTRLAFSIPLSPNYDALVSDGKDNILVAITGTTGAGVAIVDLSSIPEPAPLPYIAAAANPSRAINMRNSERSDGSANRRPKEKKSAAPPHVIPHVTNPNLLRPR